MSAAGLASNRISENIADEVVGKLAYRLMS